MKRGAASCSMFDFKGRCNDMLEGKAVLFCSSADFKCSSGLREEALLPESLSKLSNPYSLPKPNSTQKSVQTDGGRLSFYTVLYCWYSEHYPLTCLQTAHFIFPFLKFPCPNSVLCDNTENWNHKVILILSLQLLLRVPSIWHIWNLSLKKCAFSASSALLALLPQGSSAGKTRIFITRWHALTPSWLHRGWPWSSRCWRTGSTSVKSVGC